MKSEKLHKLSTLALDILNTTNTLIDFMFFSSLYQ